MVEQMCKFCETLPAETGKKYCAACKRLADDVIRETFGGQDKLDEASAKATAKVKNKRSH